MQTIFEKVGKVQNELSLVERAKAPTPKFFRKLRNIGIALGAAGSALLLAPVALPVAISTVAGYLITVGTVAAAVSQTTVDYKELAKQEQLKSI
ncbi:MAG: hypothetical protein U0Y10_04595 [Spirosomataceae bacterium]